MCKKYKNEVFIFLNIVVKSVNKRKYKSVNKSKYKSVKKKVPKDTLFQ